MNKKQAARYDSIMAEFIRLDAAKAAATNTVPADDYCLRGFAPFAKKMAKSTFEIEHLLAELPHAVAHGWATATIRLGICKAPRLRSYHTGLGLVTERFTKSQILELYGPLARW